MPLRFFRFNSSADRMSSSRDLTFNGTQTKLGEALQRAKEEFAGLPLAGLVMVTDGADTEESSIQESLLGLRASQVPVFTVGIGRETLGKDIQISRVNTPRTVLKGTNLSVDVIVAQNGFKGTTVPLNVEDSGRILSTQDVALTNDGEPTTVRVHFTATEAGARNDPVPYSCSGRRRDRAEQRARCAARRRGPQRKDPVLRRRAAFRSEVHPARRGRRPEPAARPAAAHGRKQISSAAAWTTATSWPPGSRRRATSCLPTAG